jgi:hypothetical protein
VVKFKAGNMYELFLFCCSLFAGGSKKENGFLFSHVSRRVLNYD